MLTPRGWWFLLATLFLTAFGTAVSTERGGTLAILGLTLLAWIIVEGVRFIVAVRWNRRRLIIEREIRDDRGPVTTLWAGRSFDIIVTLRSESRLPSPLALLDDRLPFGVELVEGSVRATFSQGIATIKYRIRCPAPGPVRFEGVRFQFSDPQGFLLYDTFLREPRTYPALPSLVEIDAAPKTTKRSNSLLPPGHHRVRRPGSGSELLDLRDYRPGDPPKMIAWKVSARRDTLITKEFETEVPIRCTIFVDAGQSVRLGPPGKNALTRLVTLASATTQAALLNRDHVGLAIFDETTVSYLPPARSQRHLMTLLRRLGDVGRLPASAPVVDSDTLQSIAHAFACEVYPDLLEPDINSFRWWIPILFPKPEYLRKLHLGDALFPWWRRLSLGQWQQMALRKRLAAILSVRLNVAPGGLALLLEDDESYGRALQEFLAEHLVPYPVPLYDWRGRYQFGSPEKVVVLADALTRAVRRARDNELFVLFADLFELGDRLEPLHQAIRMALGRHHQVVVVAPWQPGIPLPDEDPTVVRSGLEMLQKMRQALIARYHAAFETVRRDMGRVGVHVVIAAKDEPVPLIMQRMQQLRVAGIRR